MKVCIAGKNNIAVDCLYYAISVLQKEEICVVLNKTDNFKNTWQKSLGFFARKENIAILSLDEVQHKKDIVFISLEFDTIITPSLFNTKNLFNIHFSLLPEYKGMYTSLLPILQGKNYSGVTLHKIDTGIDTGDIIDQVKFEIGGLNCGELYSEYISKGTKMACENMKNLLTGEFDARPQEFKNSTYFSKTSFNFSQKEINTNQTAFQITNFVNALVFRAFQLPIFKNYEINKALSTCEKSIFKTGTVIDENDSYFEVASIDFNVRLYKDYYKMLIDCCKEENSDYGSKIIKHISDINEYDKNGWNPLIISCYFGSKEMLKLLLLNGANPNITNLNGTTTLMYAKESYLKTRDFEIIRILLEKGVDLYKKDIHEKSIFDYTNDPLLIDFLKSYK
ncbi:MAG: ankyrin repeat domain-containing protein [Lentimicrobium sp.]